MTGGVKRAGFGVYSDTETGSGNSGSRVGAWTYLDNGNLEGFAWWATRIRTAGSFEISRPTIWLGSTSAQTNTDARISARTGYAGMISFYENSKRRWVETSAATSGNRSLAAYNSSGSFLDTVWSLTNAAGGTWTINRPLALAAGASVTGGQYIYLRGDDSTDGSVRISSQTTGTMLIENRASGSWVSIGSFS